MKAMAKGLKPQFEDIDLPVAKPGGAGPLEEGRGPAPTLEPPIDQGAFRTLSTTVKLDPVRYGKLIAAGQPTRPGQRRRSNQEMIVEALDLWFATRGRGREGDP
jgi:hypothetical protein